MKYDPWLSDLGAKKYRQDWGSKFDYQLTCDKNEPCHGAFRTAPAQPPLPFYAFESLLITDFRWKVNTLWVFVWVISKSRDLHTNSAPSASHHHYLLTCPLLEKCYISLHYAGYNSPRKQSFYQYLLNRALPYISWSNIKLKFCCGDISFLA